jgi:hypothetical protein
MALTKRDKTDDGCQLVQVKFPGGVRPYAYKVPVELGNLSVGDFVWTQGNSYNPYGSPARVTAIGTEYAGELAVITSKLDPGFEPQTITVQRFRKQA